MNKYIMILEQESNLEKDFDQVFNEEILPQFLQDQALALRENKSIYLTLAELDDSIEMTKSKLQYMNLKKTEYIKKTIENRKFYLLTEDEFFDQLEERINE